MPPPVPRPFDGGPSPDSGSPYCAMLTCGRLTSGGATIDGSIVSLGFQLCTTAVGGVNWRGAALGRRPLLASSGDRSPPPPPPPALLWAGAVLGVYREIFGSSSVIIRATFCGAIFVDAGVNSV